MPDDGICNWCLVDSDVAVGLTTNPKKNKSAEYVCCVDCIVKALLRTLGDPARKPKIKAHKTTETNSLN